VAVTAVGALVLVTRDGDRAETTPTAPISAEEPALPPVSLIPPAVQEQGGEQTERTEEAEPVTAADAPVSEPEAAPETTLPPVTGEAGEVIVEAPDGTGLIGGGATTLER
jgi:hypothetical protein